MSERRTLAVRLSDRLESINKIHADLGTLSVKEFGKDGKTQRAALTGFGDLGDEARQIQRSNPELESRAPELWNGLKDAAGMRNVIVHEYHRTDAGIVWLSVKKDLPSLRA
jgi:uncharacterized protein with HEPN domain